ncbi:hypothetical protein [Paenibacillus medicaginis]|uniref:Uncharacterized protein n=1 Tax=Paenibacillus medicaginis TaxID=1470560 RepID=A0ABV5BXM5_9BACL
MEEILNDLKIEAKKYNNVKDFISGVNPYFDSIGQLHFTKKYNETVKGNVTTLSYAAITFRREGYQDFESFYNVNK